LGGLLQRPNGEAKRGLMSGKNCSTAIASILRPSAAAPIAVPVSVSARPATSAQKATFDRWLEGSPVVSVI
jgi:hypothetical protein